MYRIGEFSRLARVSVRMLRHYDEIGLLKPQEINDITGYRDPLFGSSRATSFILLLKTIIPTCPANTPGVFMYHCGTNRVLEHIANGMYGVIIVEPKDGYPTDREIDRSYTLVQSEFYMEHDFDDMLNGKPSYVVFNGDDHSLKEHPLLAKVGDRVRLYVNNVGPNEVSSFHVVGTTMDAVYVDGNPKNVLYGLQTVLLPASGGAVVEFTVTEEGDYPIVSHQFNQASKGAVAILRVTKDGKDNGQHALMEH